ncbi:hypothetical protein OJAV_G00009970 [Oryzias javanicus]|uniref:lysozyme n=1 Tax=Oryzias javanicus TaxID=123683 RepID=A0A3S2N8D5_ORYJA|nr:hypothetical protein OJAV_G00009970 [Oryzias javanicus]
MKLGLLLALTGAALVLNLSESRIVSKCELRQKLQQVLPLPRKYGRYKDQILALVTCELERRSQLDSNLEENTMEQNQGPSNYFGLFQFSDSFFCDSGNGLSKNLCNKSCSAFIDDDITDDLECFAYRGYWRSILDEVSSSCSDQQDTYFDECE